MSAAAKAIKSLGQSQSSLGSSNSIILKPPPARGILKNSPSRLKLLELEQEAEKKAAEEKAAKKAAKKLAKAQKEAAAAASSGDNKPAGVESAEKTAKPADASGGGSSAKDAPTDDGAESDVESKQANGLTDTESHASTNLTESAGAQSEDGQSGTSEVEPMSPAPAADTEKAAAPANLSAEKPALSPESAAAGTEKANTTTTPDMEHKYDTEPETDVTTTDGGTDSEAATDAESTDNEKEDDALHAVSAKDAAITMTVASDVPKPDVAATVVVGGNSVKAEVFQEEPEQKKPEELAPDANASHNKDDESDVDQDERDKDSDRESGGASESDAESDASSEIEDKEVATANKPVQIPDVPVNITMTKAVTVPPPKEDNTGSAAMALLIAQTGSSSTVAPATAPASAFSTVAVDVPKPSPKGDKPEGDKVETGTPDAGTGYKVELKAAAATDDADSDDEDDEEKKLAEEAASAAAANPKGHKSVFSHEASSKSLGDRARTPMGSKVNLMASLVKDTPEEAARKAAKAKLKSQLARLKVVQTEQYDMEPDPNFKPYLTAKQRKKKRIEEKQKQKFKPKIEMLPPQSKRAELLTALQTGNATSSSDVSQRKALQSFVDKYKLTETQLGEVIFRLFQCEPFYDEDEPPEPIETRTITVATSDEEYHSLQAQYEAEMAKILARKNDFSRRLHRAGVEQFERGKQDALDAAAAAEDRLSAADD